MKTKNGGTYKRRGGNIDKEKGFSEMRFTSAGYPIHNYLDDLKNEREAAKLKKLQ